MRDLAYRQIHLDFHTSGKIDGIGSAFSKEQFQQMLKLGHIDSITVFSKCHHGYAYHPTKANVMHPGLPFDLLGAQIEAAHEIGVRTPVYISAGLDEKLVYEHPEWLHRNKDDSAGGYMRAGYHLMCFNNKYLDVLAAQIEEVVRGYDCDGIFLDIVGERVCYCANCMRDMRELGMKPENEDEAAAFGRIIYKRYTDTVERAVHAIKSDMPVFHNSGHITRGRRDLARRSTHLELESLPTGGWGYDHFPLSAAYARTLGMDFLGMTGKFHTTWGEFGGYKHPNALRYEVALCAANGAKCSVGDQLHPDGMMEPATYATVGQAYAELESKEPWLKNAKNLADIALLSCEAAQNGLPYLEKSETQADAGACRILLEGKYLFDVIDTQAEFENYKVLILPDKILLNKNFKERLTRYVRAGGRVLATGQSALMYDGRGFGLDLGAKWVGESSYNPDYFVPCFDLGDMYGASYIFYGKGQEIEAKGKVMGNRENPYFNRTAEHFCSHQHTPNKRGEISPGMTQGKHGVYIAWNIFEDYAVKGSLILKRTVCHALDTLLAGKKTAEATLPAQGILTLTRQAEQKRYTAHLLYASPVRRGNGIEVIEDLLPVRDVALTLRPDEKINSVFMQPENIKLKFKQNSKSLTVKIPEFCCHAMIEFRY